MSRSVSDPTGLYGTGLSESAQRAAFTDGEVPTAVYGLGKMGLPLAAVYADVSGNTIGVDVDETVVQTINEGHSHVKREPGLSELVSEVVAEGALQATTDSAGAAERASVHVLVVPTLLTADRQPDLSALFGAVRDVAQGLSSGDLVVVESTVPPRTTVDHVRPMLAEESGVSVSEFGVAVCPERTVSGQALADIRGTHPKVVGGVDGESTRVAALLYDEISDNDVITTSDATTAEAVKVFEGVYRDVNIALANQLARYARPMDTDVTEAIDVANTQPFCDLHDPGPGVGGHCIPVYPYFLTGAFDVDGALLSTAREVNDGMVEYTVSMLERMLAVHGSAPEPRILLAGVTYKPNVAELRNAPAVALADRLHELGVRVLAVDPLVDDWSQLTTVEPIRRSSLGDVDVDAAVVVTPHDEFDSFQWDRLNAPILDGRRSIDQSTVDAPIYTIGGRWP